MSPNEEVDSFSVSDSDSEEEVDSSPTMIRPTRLGRIRTLTIQMTDFLQLGMSGCEVTGTCNR